MRRSRGNARRQPAEGRDHAQQHQRHAGRGVRRQLRAGPPEGRAFGEDQRLTGGPQQVVEPQQQEHVQRQQQHADALAGTHVGKERQRALRAGPSGASPTVRKTGNEWCETSSGWLTRVRGSDTPREEPADEGLSLMAFEQVF